MYICVCVFVSINNVGWQMKNAAKEEEAAMMVQRHAAIKKRSETAQRARILARQKMEEKKRREAMLFKHELMEVRFGVDSKRCNYKRKTKLLVQRKIEG